MATTWQQQVKDHLANGRTKEGLLQFAARPEVQQDGNMQNTLIILQSRTNGLLNKLNAGLLGESQANLQLNQINHAILQCVAQFPETADDVVAEEPVAGKGSGGTGHRAAAIPEPSPPPANGPTLLFLASNPAGSGKLQLSKEFAQISNAQQQSRFRSNIFSVWATTQMELLKNLLDLRPNFVHFACHGTDGNDDFFPQGIMLQDERGEPAVFPASSLADLVGTLTASFPIEFVLLNACGTEDHARQIAARGVSAVGMRGDWPDEDALAFASVFYMTLSQSEDLQLAFQLARTMVQSKRPGQEPIPQFFAAAT